MGSIATCSMRDLSSEVAGFVCNRIGKLEQVDWGTALFQEVSAGVEGAVLVSRVEVPWQMTVNPHLQISDWIIVLVGSLSCAVSSLCMKRIRTGDFLFKKTSTGQNQPTQRCSAPLFIPALS